MVLDKVGEHVPCDPFSKRTPEIPYTYLLAFISIGTYRQEEHSKSPTPSSRMSRAEGVYISDSQALNALGEGLNF